ncbi:MAG: tail fiber domain-containing protein [bacterium]
MGNFSRNTFDRIKHYVGVRLQQGVPIVDADWNEQEDIRKSELRTFLKWFVGNGIPQGNDGFHILEAPSPNNENDFLIKGSDGTPEGVGYCMAEGWDAIIENDIRYTEQELYNNPDLAEAWDVDSLPPLNAPTALPRIDLVFLDIWEREVDSIEDEDLIDSRIGVETCVRTKREWVVRVAQGTEGLPTPPSIEPPQGHVFYPLASLNRQVNNQLIQESIINDLRVTGLRIISDRLYIDDSGNVGIGTTDPTEKLDVAGTVKATAFEGDGSGLTGIHSLDSSDGSLEDAVYVDNSGNVGIGTTNPGEKLEVNSGSSIIGGRFISTEAFSGIAFHNSDVTTDSVLVGAQGTDLRLATNTSDRIVIKSNGNVGIGTINPSEELEVAGTVKATAFEGDGSGLTGLADGHSLDSADGSLEDAVYVDNSGNVGIGTTDPLSKLHIDTVGAGTEAKVTIRGAFNQHASIELLEYEDMGAILKYYGDWGDRFSILTGTPPTEERLTILRGSGYVGIGTTSPSYLFHVIANDGVSDNLPVSRITNLESTVNRCFGLMVQAGTSDTDYILRLTDRSAAAKVQVTGTGRVGIGTTSPGYLLHVNGTAGKPGGGSWTDSSDERLKKNVQNLTSALDKISQLQAVTFEWINPEEHGDQSSVQAGLIAQEVEKVFPDWISGTEPIGKDKELVEEGEKVKSLHFPHAFNAYLIEAIKELKAQNEVLRAENETLKQEIEHIKEVIGLLE